MYLCYSGLASEPRDYECNGLHKHSKAVSTGTLALGLLTTVLSVVYSAVRAGSSTTLLSPPSSPGAGKSLLSYFTITIIIILAFTVQKHTVLYKVMFYVLISIVSMEIGFTFIHRTNKS